MKIFFIYLFLFSFVVFSVYSETSDLVSKSKAKLNTLEKIKGSKDSSKITVAGVKAIEQVNKDELYWAGKDEVSDEEISLFKTALEKIEQKDYVEGIKKLKELLDAYPKSALAEDCVSLIKELEKK